IDRAGACLRGALLDRSAPRRKRRSRTAPPRNAPARHSQRVTRVAEYSVEHQPTMARRRVTFAGLAKAATRIRSDGADRATRRATGFLSRLHAPAPAVSCRSQGSREKGDAMSATVLYMSMSLDGFIAGPNESPENGLGDG